MNGATDVDGGPRPARRLEAELADLAGGRVGRREPLFQARTVRHGQRSGAPAERKQPLLSRKKNNQKNKDNCIHRVVFDSKLFRCDLIENSSHCAL